MKPKTLHIQFFHIIAAIALTAFPHFSCWDGFDSAYDQRWAFGQQKILFHSMRDGNNEIYIMNADRTDQNRLTMSNSDDYAPKWSPDRSRIVFVSFRDGNNEIYVMNRDGTGQTRLTNNSVDDQYPSFSPDGSHIVFMSTRAPHPGWAEIYTMKADGSEQTRLTYFSSTCQYPSWSPTAPALSLRAGKTATGMST
jgi:Tol biopolymer transport system component